MGNVIGSASEAKIGSTSINDQYSVPLRTFLAKMGHPQPPTKIQLDNTTMEALSKGNLKGKWSTAIDMCLYWHQDRETQVQFNIF